MRLLITRAMPERVVARAQTLCDVVLRAEDRPLTPPEAAQALADYDAVLCTLGDGFRGDGLPGPARCKLLANFGVGYNHIDVARARALGLRVTNTPGAVTDATADIAMTLLLMSCRRASEGERLLRRGAWQGWAPTQLLGAHVSGKRLGIVGMGRIGQAVARRAHLGFGMAISYFNRSPKELPFAATRVENLTTLMAQSDMVVVALPGGGATRHLIGAPQIAAMPAHAHLINVARGDILDEAALIAALEARQIAGAGLDVYEHEPQVPEALRALDNVTLLPHLGTAALEVREAMGLMALDNIEALAQGQALPNEVLA